MPSDHAPEGRVEPAGVLTVVPIRRAKADGGTALSPAEAESFAKP